MSIATAILIPVASAALILLASVSELTWAAETAESKFCVRDALASGQVNAYEACSVMAGLDDIGNEVDHLKDRVTALEVESQTHVAAVIRDAAHGDQHEAFFFKTATPAAAFADLVAAAAGLFGNAEEETLSFRTAPTEGVSQTFLVTDDATLEATFYAAKEWGFKITLVARFETVGPTVSPTDVPTTLAPTTPYPTTSVPTSSPTFDKYCVAPGYFTRNEISSFCREMDGDGLSGSWLLVWRHSYGEVFSNPWYPTADEVATYAYWSSTYIPCTSGAKACNLPNKASAYGTPVKQMTLATHNGVIKYAYMGSVSDHLDEETYEAAILNDDVKLIDTCRSGSNGVPPEPHSSVTPGLVFDKWNKGVYTGNHDTGMYTGSDARWANCRPDSDQLYRVQQTIEIYLYME